MALNLKIVKEGNWGVLVKDDDEKVLLIDPDTSIRLGIQLIIAGQDAIHAKSLQMVCMDKGLPPDTFIEMWGRISEYISILNSNQKDTEPLDDGNDTSD